MIELICQNYCTSNIKYFNLLPCYLSNCSFHNIKLKLLQHNLHSYCQSDLIRKMATKHLIGTFGQNLSPLRHIKHPILDLKLKRTILTNPHTPILPIYTKFLILILTRYIHTLQLVVDDELRFVCWELLQGFLGLFVLLGFADWN